MARKRRKPLPDGPRMVAYGRVSTDDQDLTLQINAFHAIGVLDDNIHTDKKSGVSKRRPGLRYALLDIREGDTFVVWKLDRLGRSPPELYATLTEILSKGCGFKSLTENIDVSTPAGRLLFGIFSAIAGFERDLIAERTAAGLAVLKERQGKDWKWGRKLFMTPKRIAQVGKMLNSGMSGPAVAAKLKISTASVYAHWKQDAPGRFVRKRPKAKKKAK